MSSVGSSGALKLSHYGSQRWCQVFHLSSQFERNISFPPFCELVEDGLRVSVGSVEMFLYYLFVRPCLMKSSGSSSQKSSDRQYKSSATIKDCRSLNLWTSDGASTVYMVGRCPHYRSCFYISYWVCKSQTIPLIPNLIRPLAPVRMFRSLLWPYVSVYTNHCAVGYLPRCKLLTFSISTVDEVCARFVAPRAVITINRESYW